jgi:flagellin
MGLVISTNFAAAFAARQVEKNNDGLVQSLNRLSSGQRIVNPYDDAGGMAVQLKMRAAISRGGVAKNTIQNAISLLQTQDGVLQTATNVVSRIAELKAMSQDATKNSQDIQNYNEEYQVLREQLEQLQNEKFNGRSLFGDFSAATQLTDTTQDEVFQIWTTEQGSGSDATSTGPSVILTGVNLSNTSVGTGVALITTSIDAAYTGDVTSLTAGGLASSGLTMDGILSDLQKLANARAKNGALQSRLNYAYDQASISKSNMEAARSRIIDVDIAEESSNFASKNILMQASSSMLAQANNTSRTALQLLLQ